MNDLNLVLRDVLEHFHEIKQEIHIDWVNLDEVEHWLFDEANDWGSCLKTKEHGFFIGIHPSLRKAPRYVLEYLVFHEVLHIALPRRGNCAHHKAFKVAERVWPDYLKACAWLDSHS